MFVVLTAGVGLAGVGLDTGVVAGFCFGSSSEELSESELLLSAGLLVVLAAGVGLVGAGLDTGVVAGFF